MTVNFWIERLGHRRHIFDYLDNMKRLGITLPKIRVVGRTSSLMKRGKMNLGFNPKIHGKAKVSPPPDVPFVKLRKANKIVHRVGYCTFCGVPIFSINKEDVLNRCHKHSNDSTKWSRG